MWIRSQDKRVLTDGTVCYHIHPSRDYEKKRYCYQVVLTLLTSISRAPGEADHSANIIMGLYITEEDAIKAIDGIENELLNFTTPLYRMPAEVE